MVQFVLIKNDVTFGGGVSPHCVTELVTNQKRCFTTSIPAGLQMAIMVFDTVKVLNGVIDIETITRLRDELRAERQSFQSVEKATISDIADFNLNLARLNQSANLIDVVLEVLAPSTETKEVAIVIDTLEKLNDAITEVDLFNPDVINIRKVIQILLNSSGIGEVNEKKPALRQIIESLGRNDIDDAQAVKLYLDVIGGLITTNEQIEELAESVVEEAIMYHVLTKAGQTTDLNGNVIKKIRHYFSIPLLEVQVAELLEQGFDLAPTTSISIDNFFAQFDDPIALATVPNNVINDKPITILNDGSTSPINEGVFEEETPNTSILDEGSLDEDTNSQIESDTPVSNVGEEQTEQLTVQQVLDKIAEATEGAIPEIPEAQAETPEEQNPSPEKEKGFEFKGINFTATQIVILIIAILLALVGFGGAFIA